LLKIEHYKNPMMGCGWHFAVDIGVQKRRAVVFKEHAEARGRACGAGAWRSVPQGSDEGGGALRGQRADEKDELRRRFFDKKLMILKWNIFELRNKVSRRVSWFF